MKRFLSLGAGVRVAHAVSNNFRNAERLDPLVPQRCTVPLRVWLREHDALGHLERLALRDGV